GPPCMSTMVSTLAGNGTGGFVDGTGGPAGTTQFQHPGGLAIDGAGNLYVGDIDNNRIRVVAPDGTTTTLAGNGGAGAVDGTGRPTGTTQINGPQAVALDGAGNVYVAEWRGNRVRKIAPSGDTTTLAGNGGLGWADGSGGPGGTAMFGSPAGLAIDMLGSLYVG